MEPQKPSDQEDRIPDKAGGQQAEGPAKDLAKREMLDLLKDRSLSTDEQKKILAVATSLDGRSSLRDEAQTGTKIAKALLIAIAILGIMLLAGAWYFLRKLQDQADDLGPSRSKPGVEAPARPGRK